MIKKEIRVLIKSQGWAKTFTQMKTQKDRQLFLAIVNEYEYNKAIMESYMPFMTV